MVVVGVAGLEKIGGHARSVVGLVIRGHLVDAREPVHAPHALVEGVRSVEGGLVGTDARLAHEGGWTF